MNSPGLAALNMGIPPVPAPDLKVAMLGWGPCPENGEYKWQIIYTNGDEHRARQEGAAWMERGLGTACCLVIPNGDRAFARVVTRVEWGK